MNGKEMGHIQGNLPELTNKTVWNTSCKTVPLETGVFDQDDIVELEAIPNEKYRILRFYELFLKKKDSYQHLITTLEDGSQSGALEILNKLDVNSPIAEPKSSQCFELTDDDEMTQDDEVTDGDDVTEDDEVTDDDEMTDDGETTDDDEISEKTRDGETCSSDPTFQSGSESSIAGSNRRQVSMRIQFDLMPPVELFTGRVNQLAYLHEKLQQTHTSSTMFSHMAAIVGVGGIGKTELARMYIQKYEEAYDNNVIWINAETEETLTETFQRLAADYLQISLLNEDEKEKHVKSLVEEAYNFFEDKQCLFVFDNAECNENFRSFMPPHVPHSHSPHVLLTSRDRDWEFSVEMVELTELYDLEAINFVKDGLEIQDDKQDQLVFQLVKTLQCFPIAISQAISYIQRQKIIKDYNIKEYLEDYKSCSEKQLRSRVLLGEQITYAKTAFTTWKMTRKLLSKNRECGEVAISLLNMIAYFQPNKIPTHLLICGDMKKIKLGNISKAGILSRTAQFFLGCPKIVSVCKSASTSLSFPEKCAKALELLVNYSMVSIHPTEETISIHRLVQEVTRIEVREKKLETRILKNSLKLLSENLYLNTVSHFCSVFKYCGAYKKLVVSYKDIPWTIIDDEDNEAWSTYLSLIIGIELKETLQKHVCFDDVAVIKLEYMLARAHFRAKNFNLSSKAFEQILPFYLENKNDMFTGNEILCVQNSFGYALAILGRIPEGLKVLLEAYKYAKEFHGLNYWWTIQILLLIAVCLHKLNYFQKPTFENQECVQELMEVSLVPEPQEIISLLKAAYEKKKQLIGTDGNYFYRFYTIAHFFMVIGEYEIATTIAKDVYEKGRHSNDTRIQIKSMDFLEILETIKERRDAEALRIQEQGPISLEGVNSLARSEALLKRDFVKY
ncbi:unnamed protein product [Orchesella dallaii]|uniref:NB-ARC domain-containing protein n=1 Tax=Orchesella dallaii TaxID=48710 RepID=A0ABP1RX83_9HEXA